jgi:hypothetical protein
MSQSLHDKQEVETIIEGRRNITSLSAPLKNEEKLDESDSIYSWMWKRLPNYYELTNDALYNVIEIGYEDKLKKFGANPTNKDFVRDLAKVPSVFYASYNGIEIGNTGIKNGMGNVVSQVIKPSCKFSVIGISEFFFSAKYAKYASATSNLVCEPIARVFSLSEKLMQVNNATDVGYFSYLSEKVKSPYFFSQAILQSLIKTTVTSFLSEGLNMLGLFKKMDIVSNRLLASFLSKCFDKEIKFKLHDTKGKEIYINIASKLALIPIENDFCKKIVLYPLEFARKTIVGSLRAAIFLPVGRIAEDAAEHALKGATSSDDVSKYGHNKISKEIPKADTTDNCHSKYAEIQLEESGYEEIGLAGKSGTCKLENCTIEHA